MTIGTTTYNLGVSGAAWGDYSAHNAQINADWITAYNDAAEKARTAAFFQAAQAVIIAGIQANAASHAADRQWDIANRQMTIAEDEYQRYKDHFICVEHHLADDACNEVLYVPDYVTRAGRAQADIRVQFDVARRKLARTRSRYCVSDMARSLCLLEAEEAKAIAAARDASYRAEEIRRDAYDDRRFNRRISVSNLGRTIQAQQVSTYQGAMGMADAAIGTKLNGMNNFLGALSGGISGIIQANLQKQIAPSPFVGAYANSGPQSAYGGYQFNYGGPSPMGAGAATGSGANMTSQAGRAGF